MIDSTYTITNKTTGETKDVIPHTFGTEEVFFAEPAEGDAWTNAVLYRFANPNQDGTNLSSEEWDIKLKEDATN